MSFYHQGLEELLQRGNPVKSVQSELSKASNFGLGNRPYLELLAHQLDFKNSAPSVVWSVEVPIHLAYCFGLLAWTLAGRDDLSTLAYYRASARDFSDDGLTMCGAFGRRLQSRDGVGDQLSSIVDRLRSDPTSRRTYAAIIDAQDNLSEKIEYPCAAGVQFFLRDHGLDMLTVMRAQQALTVLPYDVFLFSAIHHFVSAELGVPTGTYHHFSGTFHIYENERELAARVCQLPEEVLTLPHIPQGNGAAVKSELIALEEKVRVAAECKDWDTIDAIDAEQTLFDFTQVAKRALVDFARELRN